MAAKEEPVEDPVEEPVEELDAPAEGDALPPEDEVALTVLHTADWHLGRRFPAFDEDDARTLSRARLEVVGGQLAHHFAPHLLGILHRGL